ncbi:prolyl oligopeptidase family serine peptidase [Alishewanella aestuarii]|uniref:S9 family peptidase n=1 Tax=Alishewanella aestuarii TaxID=453835 RepID=UPI001930D439|nr:prolyl oligopeptidase family serine peptidase [Alishewanella aestuarii]
MAQFDYHRLMTDVGPSWMRLSPDQQWVMMASGAAYPSIYSESNEGRIELLGREFYVDRPLESGSFVTDKVKLIHISTGQSKELRIPERNIRDARWSPDSKNVAFVGVAANALDIWHFQLSQQQPELWSDIAVSGQLEAPSIVWLPDSQNVILRHSRMQPVDTLTPAATLQIADTQSVQTRVYRNTLDTDFNRQKFSALLRQQAVLLSKNGEVRSLTAELLLESISISPDGRYLLVQHISDEVQPGIRFNRLAREYQVVDIATGNISAVLPKLQTDLVRAREPDAAAEGARLVQWRPDQPATLIWAEGIELRGHAVDASYRDAVFTLAAPFTASPEELFKTSWRLHQLHLTEGGRLLYSDFHSGLKQLRYWDLLLGAADKPQRLLLHYDYTNSAEFPGELVSQLLPDGRTQLVTNKAQAIYFQADGQNRWGDGAYLVRLDAESMEQQIVFASSDQQQRRAPLYLRMQDDKEWLLLTKESAQRAPSLWLSHGSAAEQLIYDWHSDALIATPEPLLLEFQRADGVQLYSQLFLPEKAVDQLLPAVIWLYPREYHTHQQQPKPSRQSLFQPVDPMGPLVALLDGYAVVDASQAPIIRQDGQEPNDTFRQQQQLNIDALIAALESTGRIDRNRLVLMGHSYGAFSAVSLLTERSDFRCAIARSGAYNRSLTPLGFQGEKRTLWQAPDLYQQLSPFFHADKVTTPVLLIHGSADENPGTAALQSEMMFQALQAQQVQAKLLLLNKERHAYRYRETIEQMLIAQSAWLRQCAQLD